MNDFVKKILTEQEIRSQQLPEEVELVTRSGKGEKFDFYLNHGEKETNIKLPGGKYEDIITQTINENILHLEKYGVAILKKIDHYET